MEVFPFNTSDEAEAATFTTLIVVPCYNEAARLPVAEFSTFAERQPDIRFVFVNDGSSDKTSELLRELVASNPKKFEFVDLPRNGGKAEAIRQGVLHSLQHAPSAIGFWDADLSTPLDPIIDFIRVLQRHKRVQLVIGSRLPLLGRRIQRKPIRRLLGRVFVTVASIALRLRIRDTQCGAKLFRVSPELAQVYNDPFLAKWIFDVELIARYLQLRRQFSTADADDFIYEQPLDSWEEIGSSRLKSQDFATAIIDLARIYLKYLRPGASWSAGDPRAGAAAAPNQHESSSDTSDSSRRVA
ncbi:MAG: glycosyltransferase [Planctomycetaceae bacterium]|nr:glycosyltransferase [Planctomycetales bacterium]MCB9925937.1 glycosyltransferase [Planctomycetaceae bacterium]